MRTPQLCTYTRIHRCAVKGWALGQLTATARDGREIGHPPTANDNKFGKKRTRISQRTVGRLPGRHQRIRQIESWVNESNDSHREHIVSTDDVWTSKHWHAVDGGLDDSRHVLRVRRFVQLRRKHRTIRVRAVEQLSHSQPAGKRRQFQRTYFRRNILHFNGNISATFLEILEIA